LRLCAFLRGETVDAERISRYRKALSDLKKIAEPDDYNIIAPICEKAIAELERRLREEKPRKAKTQKSSKKLGFNIFNILFIFSDDVLPIFSGLWRISFRINTFGYTPKSFSCFFRVEP